MKGQEQNVEMEVKSSEVTSLGDVNFKRLMDEYDKKQSPAKEVSESPYDTEFEIKEPAGSDLHSMPDDEVVSIFGFGTDDSNEEGTEYTKPK
nr:hypothetical protein [Tanacetum cinerariifolium]